MSKRESKGTWLEHELRSGLTRVPAPRELWDRVTLPLVDNGQVRPRGRVVWMLAGASAIMASLLAVAWGYHPASRLYLESNRVQEVRGWVKSRTGMDIPLADQHGGGVEMLGASIADTGVVEVQYRAASESATLLITRSSNSSLHHDHADLGDLEGATRVSWNTGGYAYTLAVQRAGVMRMACLVCHIEATI